MNDRGQALIEYTLIAVALTFGLFVMQNAAGPLWPTLMQHFLLYNQYNGGFDALLSVPFP